MTSEVLRIGIVQTNIVWEDIPSNCAHIQSLLPHEEHIDLLLLPEMWSTGFSMRPEAIAENSDGIALKWMYEHSQKLNSAIAGSLSIREDGKYYNRWYCVHPDGRTDHYDKRHLFSFGKENQHYTAGKEKIIIEIKGWKIMPIICYDLRFPAWCRNNLDYDLLVVAANWPTPRIHHWDALLKARAIENQSYIAAINRVGMDANGHQYPGHSAVYDMDGKVVMDLKDNETVGLYELDKDALSKYREHFQFLRDQDHIRYIME